MPRADVIFRTALHVCRTRSAFYYAEFSNSRQVFAPPSALVFVAEGVPARPCSLKGAGYACSPCPLRELSLARGGMARRKARGIHPAHSGANRNAHRLAAHHRGVFMPASGRAFIRHLGRIVSRLPAGTPSGPGRSPDAARERGRRSLRARAPHLPPSDWRHRSTPLAEEDYRNIIIYRNFVKRQSRCQISLVLKIIIDKRNIILYSEF